MTALLITRHPMTSSHHCDDISLNCSYISCLKFRKGTFILPIFRITYGTPSLPPLDTPIHLLHTSRPTYHQCNITFSNICI